MDRSKIRRINELAKKQKTIGLTAEEKEEQKILRKQYIDVFKNNLRSTLDNVKFTDEKN